MRKIATVIKKTGLKSYLVEGMNGVTYTIYTDRALPLGETVLLVNGNVVSIAGAQDKKIIKV